MGRVPLWKKKRFEFSRKKLKSQGSFTTKLLKCHLDPSLVLVPNFQKGMKENVQHEMSAFHASK
jgi:hypothetical protein